MPTNASPEFIAAQKKFLQAGTDEEKLLALEEMIKEMPKHKSAEALRKNLRTRHKKLKQKLIKEKQSKKGKGKKGIKKADMQACLIGLTNSGKSSILVSITNAKPEISPYQYTTKQPTIGTLNYQGMKIQIIDLPAIESELFDQGIANNTDTLLITITNLQDLQKIQQFLKNALGKQLIIFNKIDLLNKDEKRKIEATLKSKKLNFVLFSTKTKENTNLLEEKIWQTFNKIRVYTKKHGQKADNEPVVLDRDATILHLADKIRIPIKNIKQTTITGPSSKFPRQKIGIQHVLQDKDIVEFKTS